MIAEGLVAAGVLGAGGAAAYALLYPQTQVCGPVYVAPRTPGEVALTFDDGPNPEATPRLLEVLAGHGVKATFFLIGEFARQEPRLVREIAASGHVLGNHTMTHPWLPLVSGRRAAAEIRDCSALIEDIAGAPVRWFRAPHGARQPAAVRAAAELGMTTVAWNVIVSDWLGGPAEAIAGRVERGVAARVRAGWGANVVLHDGGHLSSGEPRLATVEAVRLLLARGVDTQFVTLEDWVKR